VPKHVSLVLQERDEKMQLNLTDSDARLLSATLSHYLEELRREIAATDQKEFRLSLREREALLERVIGELSR
jgi:hypothetical protein